MLCQKCNKRTATVHLTDLMTGESLEKHLCERCAQEDGVGVQQHSSVEKLLTDIVMSEGSQKEGDDVECEQCGLSFGEYRSKGLLGCPNDYVAFEQQLEQWLERAHEGASHHIGKVPQSRGDAERDQVSLMRLRRELEEAVKVEDYEAAANLRDQIAGLEGS
jgi:protein arginine kinase activator